MMEASRFAHARRYRARMVPTVDVDDAHARDVRQLLEAHLAFARSVTPHGHVHALDGDALDDEDITLYSARNQGALVGICALRELDAAHGELKSMHVRRDRRGGGTGRALVDHVLAEARRRGYRRVSLETGTYDAFAPARALYRRVGFRPCAPFADYSDNPFSTCMTIPL
jgi:putative acetyltransferase